MFARLLKFNPNHDEHGRFTTSEGGADVGVVRSLLGKIKDSGGFTYHTVTKREPHEGFVLSVYPERSFAKDAKDLKPKDLIGYIKRNRDLLKTADAHLGAWHDKETGKVFLDVSVVKSDEREAAKLAKEKDQIAYWDLKNMKSVEVNRAATSGGVAKGASDGERNEAGPASSQGAGGHDAGGRDHALQADGGARPDAAGDRGSQGRVAKGLASIFLRLLKYSPDQARDDHGRWTDEGGSSKDPGLHPAGDLHPEDRYAGLTPAEKKAQIAKDEERILQKVLTPEERKIYDAQVRDLADKIANNEETFKKYAHRTYVDDQGKQHWVGYSKERKDQQRDIIAKVLQEALDRGALPDKGQPPQMQETGGRGGSGKTNFSLKLNPDGTVAKDQGQHLGLYDPRKFVVLDADMFKKELAQLDGKRDVGHLAYLYHEESGHMFDLAVRAARAMGMNVVMDVTMNSSHLERMQSFKKAGYEVTAMYMHLPPEKAAERALNRWKNEDDKTKVKDYQGRLVLPSIVLGNQKNERNFDETLKVADHYVVYNNDVPRGSPPLLRAASSKIRQRLGKAEETVDRLLKYNTVHVPAGSPEGGQFTTAGEETYPAAMKLEFDTRGGSAVYNGETGKKLYYALEDAATEAMRNMTTEEKAAIRMYTDEAYRPINKALGVLAEGRSPLAMYPEASWIPKLDSALAKSTIPENITVYRGMAIKNLVGFLPNDVTANFTAESLKPLIGTTYKETGYASTTVLRHTYSMSYSNASSLGVVGLEIQVPKGSKGMLVRPLSHVSTEHEVLLPRDSRFKIIGVDTRLANENAPDFSGRPVLKVRLLKD